MKQEYALQAAEMLVSDRNTISGEWGPNDYWDPKLIKLLHNMGVEVELTDHEETMTITKAPRRDNCASCSHLQCNKVFNNRVFFCGHDSVDDGPIVPHRVDSESAEFWRIPMECKLSDVVVNKRPKHAPKKTWTEIKLEQL